MAEIINFVEAAKDKIELYQCPKCNNDFFVTKKTTKSMNIGDTLKIKCLFCGYIMDVSL